jgi:hypothetical protein
VKARRGQNAATATIRRDLTALSSVLAYCEGEEWIEGNAALSRLRRLRERRDRIVLLRRLRERRDRIVLLRRLRERRDPIVLPDHLHIEQVIERAPGNVSSSRSRRTLPWVGARPRAESRRLGSTWEADIRACTAGPNPNISGALDRICQLTLAANLVSRIGA